MKEFMKKHYWTPGWLILGPILLVIGSFLGGTWAFLVGMWIGLWLAYPMIREQYDRARREGWAAGYKTITLNFSAEWTISLSSMAFGLSWEILNPLCGVMKG